MCSPIATWPLITAPDKSASICVAARVAPLVHVRLRPKPITLGPPHQPGPAAASLVDRAYIRQHACGRQFVTSSPRGSSRRRPQTRTYLVRSLGPLVSNGSDLY